MCYHGNQAIIGHIFVYPQPEPPYWLVYYVPGCIINSVLYHHLGHIVSEVPNLKMETISCNHGEQIVQHYYSIEKAGHEVEHYIWYCPFWICLISLFAIEIMCISNSLPRNLSEIIKIIMWTIIGKSVLVFKEGYGYLIVSFSG